MPDPSQIRIPPDLKGRRLLTDAGKIAKLKDAGIVVDAKSLMRQAKFTPRRLYKDSSAYVRLYSPSFVDPNTTPPAAQFPDTRGGLEIVFRMAGGSAYIIDCVLSGTAPFHASYDAGGSGDTITRALEDGHFSIAIPPRRNGTVARLMLTSSKPWTWTETSITPARG